MCIDTSVNCVLGAWWSKDMMQKWILDVQTAARDSQAGARVLVTVQGEKCDYCF